MAVEKGYALGYLLVSLFSLIYLFCMGVITFLISFWINRIDRFNKKVISKELSKSMFEANLVQMGIAPVSIILTSSLYKYGFLGLIFLTVVLFIFLFVITSQSFINFIFNIQECVLEMEKVFNKFFSYVVSSYSVPLYCNKIKSKNNLNYSYRSMSTCGLGGSPEKIQKCLCCIVFYIK